MTRRRRNFLAVSLLIIPIGFGLFLAGASIYSSSNFYAAQAALERGDYPQAEVYLKRSLFAWSGSGQVHFDLVRSYRLQGKYDEARAELDECRRTSWPAEAIELEEILLRAHQGEFSQVEDRVLQYAEEDTEATSVAQEALVHIYLRRFQMGLALYWGEKYLKHSPTSVPILTLVAQIHLSLNKTTDAITYYRRALEIAPDDDQVKQGLAEALLTSSEPTKALQLYEDLVDRHPDSRAILLGLARSCRAVGRLKTTRSALEKLVTQHSADPIVLSELGELAYREHKYGEAVGWLRQSVAISPYDSKTLFALYQSLRQVKTADAEEKNKVLARYDDVQKIETRLTVLAREEIPRNPRRPEAFYELAILYLRINKEELAESNLRQAFDLLAAQGDSSAAAGKALSELVRTQIVKLPREPAAYYAAALLYRAGGLDAEATAYLKKTIHVDPKYGKAHRELARYHARLGDSERAAKHAALAAGKDFE